MFSIWRYLTGNQTTLATEPIKSQKEQVNGTIQRLEESLAVLSQREMGLQKEIERNRHEAKDRIKINDRLNAELYLKKAKMLETSLSGVISTKFNLSTQVTSLQSMLFTNQLVSNMELTRDTFRALGRECDPVYAQQLAREVTEEITKASAVENALAGSNISNGDVTDELCLLQAEVDQERRMEADLAALELERDLPTVPERKLDSLSRSVKTRSEIPIGNTPYRPRMVSLKDGIITDTRPLVTIPHIF